MIDTSGFACVDGRVETDRVVVRGSRVRRTHHSARLPAITEWRDWLAAAGLTDARFMAGDGRPPAIDRPRLVVVAVA